jgi:hypothetical protein
MNTETPNIVVKGDLDSTIHQDGFGSFGDAGGSFGILGVLLVAKVALVLFLVGLYYLFTFSPVLGLLALCAPIVAFLTWWLKL